MSVGRFHTCAHREDGVILRTGKNDTGALASGDLERRLEPTQVVGVE